MKRLFLLIPFFVVMIFVWGLTRQNLQTTKDDYWLRKCPTEGMDRCSYVDRVGKIKIPRGKYNMIYTDTFRTMAIVYDTSIGCIGINKKCEKLFNVFWFDNGPDYLSEDLFRITDNRNPFKQKIGFANLNGEIVVPIKFDFAEPFSEGLSAFCQGCVVREDQSGEHNYIDGGKWGYINKKGEVVIEPKYDWADAFSNDSAWVRLDSMNYCIDKTGKILKENIRH